MTDSQRAFTGVLYIIPTPIGNLADMVPRAVDILQTVDLIAAEDTRHSGKLLQYFQINTPMVAYHDHSGDYKVQSLIDRLQQGASIALISDAGTPLVSDPGYRLVMQARRQGLTVVPVPGACAAIAALSASGLPSDRFAFEGFPPAKSGARKRFFEDLAEDGRTLIFYESPHRIEASLTDICSVFGADREIVLAREITKTFETFLCGSSAEVLARVTADANQQKGEIVVMVRGYSAPPVAGTDISSAAQKLMTLLLGEALPLKQAASITANATGEKKNRLYEWGLAFSAQ